MMILIFFYLRKGKTAKKKTKWIRLRCCQMKEYIEKSLVRRRVSLPLGSCLALISIKINRKILTALLLAFAFVAVVVVVDFIVFTYNHLQTLCNKNSHFNLYTLCERSQYQ